MMMKTYSEEHNISAETIFDIFKDIAPTGDANLMEWEIKEAVRTYLLEAGKMERDEKVNFLWKKLKELKRIRTEQH